jgi:hypothetical protein
MVCRNLIASLYILPCHNLWFSIKVGAVAHFTVLAWVDIETRQRRRVE